MTEKEPLNERNALNGRIVPAALKPHTNGLTNGVNGHIDAPVHIEAPCCRDIHGKEPPDGGTRAWLVVISAFLCNGVIFGIINTYGVIHSLLSDRLTEQGDTEANSKAALVGSLTIGTTFLLSPVAGCLTDKIGLRLTTFIGGVLSAGGLLLSSFCTQNIFALYMTYGIMFGCGAALAYTPTLAILGHYFKRYLGKVSGCVTAGSSVFTVILPPALDYLLVGHGLEVTLRIMSFVSAFIIVCSFVYKPLHPPPEPPKKKAGRSQFNLFLRSIINTSIWKRKKYVIWAMCVPMALFGYFVPYVHMMKFVKAEFPGKSENLPVQCIGITSGIGRLIFGVIADIPGVNRIYLQQLSLVCIGVVTLLLPLTSSYIVLIAFSLIMGLFDGCFISLLGPIAYEICGPSGATQAIGFLLGLSSVPLTVGPPIAGKIYASTGSYMMPLILAGIPPIVGALVLFTIRCVNDDEVTSASNGVAQRAIENDLEGVRELKELYNEDEPKAYSPLMNGHTINTAEAPGESPSGRARLADTGTLTQSASFRVAHAVDKVKLYTACSCKHSSSSLKTNHSRLCSQTALLGTAGDCMSTVVTDENLFGARSLPNHKTSSASNENIAQRRRYTYSIY